VGDLATGAYEETTGTARGWDRPSSARGGHGKGSRAGRVLRRCRAVGVGRVSVRLADSRRFWKVQVLA